MRRLTTNCPNCGGILSEGRCPYCGTHVRYANELDIGFGRQPIEVQLNIKQGDSVLIMPLYGCITEISTTYNHLAEPEVQFVFNGIIGQGV